MSISTHIPILISAAVIVIIFEILLDISELEDIDITGIQILLAAKKEAEEKNKIFNIVGNIPEVIKAYSDGFQVSLDSLLKQQEKENA